MGNRILPDNTLITFARQLADSAGIILREAFHTSIKIEQKQDASPVTEADRAVEERLRTLIEAQYPAHGIVGEEFGNIRQEAPYQWVIDPIDGTHAFIAGETTFTTLIALCENNIPILGVIDQPIRKERWVGVSGQASPAPLSPCQTLVEARLGATALQYFTPDQAVPFERVSKACAHTHFGGDAYLFGQIVAGHIDVVVEAGLKPYDFCALRPVIESAGGIITDWDGRALTLHSDGRIVAAANAQLHAQVLRLLNK